MFRYVLQIQILSIVVNKVSKMDYVFLFFKGGRKFSKNQSEVSDIASILEICRAITKG